MLALSIRPEHALKILSGRKTIELRNWRPKNPPERFLLHVSEDQAAVAILKLEGIKQYTPETFLLDRDLHHSERFYKFGYLISLESLLPEPVSMRGHLSFWETGILS